MEDLQGRVAVVTGAASGIGLAMSERFAAEGMKVVLADIEEEVLAQAADRVRAAGAECLSVVTDVSNPDEVDSLARETVKTFGGVHVLCNNAGVMKGGLSWEAPLEDYAWHLGVNLWGVIHGIRSFIPIMDGQGSEAHIVNTSSMSGLTCTPYTAAYCVSKHAVVALSECLFHELALSGSQIRVSVLVPTAVSTNIANAERNRPSRFEPPHRQGSDYADMVAAGAAQALEQGLAPAEVAEQVIRAIHEGRFHIFTEGGDSERWLTVIHKRLDDIREFRNPTFPVPDDLASMLPSAPSGSEDAK